MTKDVIKRLYELDIARALAICAIVFVHSYYFLETDPNLFGRLYFVSTAVLSYLLGYIANLALALFFFVSGYALYWSNKSFGTWHDAASFFKRRALRLFPLYWVAVFIYVVFGFLPLQAYAFNYNAANLAAWFSPYGSTTIAIYVLGLQGLISTAPYVTHEMTALWFVGVIWVFYLIYPLLIAFSSKPVRFIAVSILAYVALAATQLLVHTLDSRLFVFFGPFVGGMFASKYALSDKWTFVTKKATSGRRFASRIVPSAIPCFCVAFVIGLFSTFGVRGLSSLLPSSFVAFVAYAITGLLCFLFSLFAIAVIRAVLTTPDGAPHRLYRLVAYSTYTIYLFQLPILVGLGFVLTYALYLTAIQTDLILIVVGVPGLFITCYLLQSLQDTVLKRIKTRRGAQPRTHMH
jgi:peptidoglycan/LPS O-acetylase OafA/YrhL